MDESVWYWNGLGGAILCISTQPSDDLASNAPLGNLMCLVSSLVYAVYLVLSNRLLKGVGNMTMLKYTVFRGGCHGCYCQYNLRL